MKNLIFVVATFFVLLLANQIVNAMGLSVLPAVIRIINLVRGSQFNVTISVYNPSDYEDTFSISTSDEAVGWISFYSVEDRGLQINQITVPSSSSKNFIAYFKIPKDAPNGYYESKIYVGSSLGTGGENISALTIRVPISVSLDIIGEQILTGKVINITATDTEVNRLLRIKAEFQNTGEVIATPRVEATIKKSGVEIANFTYNKTSVNVGAIDIIETEWDTTGQTVGDYVANVKVYIEKNRLLDEENVNFKLLERGTLTAEGKISNVNAPQETSLGQVTKIEIQFQNTGQIDVTAKITGEVYSGDRLIDTISGDETLVKIGETKTLTSYFKPEKSGEYIIKANVVYEGKTLEMDPISISVKSSSPLTGFSILPILTNPIFLGVLITIIAVAIAVLIKKRRYYSSFSHKKFRYFSLAYSWLKYTYKPFYNVLSRFAFLMFLRI